MSTSEIDPQSAQVREVYARFGLAVFHAQCLERQVAILLATVLNPSFVSSSPLERDWAHEVEFAKTLGRLVSTLRTRVSIRADLESQLSNAVRLRNWLVHRYFWERAFHFTSDAGRIVMTNELIAAARDLSQLDDAISGITLKWAEKAGITPETIEAHVKRLQSEHGV